MEKKNLLLISSSSKTGGGPSHIFQLSNLIKDNYNLFYAMPKLEKLPSYLEKINLLEIKERNINLTDIKNLIIFSRKNSIDIIHAHGKGAGILGRLLKLFINKPLIYTFHGIHIECLGKFKKYLYIFYENFFGWIDNHKIFVSESERQYAKNYNLYIGKNYSVINNFVPNNNKKELIKDKYLSNKKIKILNDKRNIISVCRLVEQKNIFEILKIAKISINYNFLIIGGGPLFNYVNNFIKQKKINNVFLFGNQSDIFKYLELSDLFLSTSLYEGHPISILEAMSIGLPIVASQVAGNVDTFLNNHSGNFYSLGNVNMASLKIKNILEDPVYYEKLSKNSFSLQRQLFSLDKSKKKYLTLYKEFHDFYNKNF